jgi:hypothetical protein
MSMTINSVVERALSARDTPVLYWLGKGGWLAGAPPEAQRQPGRPIALQTELAQMRTKRPAVYAAYMDGLAASGLALDALPALACDCSGFVDWALGLPRDGAPWAGGWFNTDTIHADATGRQQRFVPLALPRVGALLVYPKPTGRGPDGPPGHIGIVTALGPDGRVARVLHCAPHNFLLGPPPGLPRSAIAETGTELFDAEDSTLPVLWKDFA